MQLASPKAQLSCATTSDKQRHSNLLLVCTSRILLVRLRYVASVANHFNPFRNDMSVLFLLRPLENCYEPILGVKAAHRIEPGEAGLGLEDASDPQVITAFVQCHCKKDIA